MSCLIDFSKKAPPCVAGLKPLAAWRTPSSTDKAKSYVVELYAKDGIDFWACSCRAWTFSGSFSCKHCRTVSQRYYAQQAKLVTLDCLDQLAVTLQSKVAKARERHFDFGDVSKAQDLVEELGSIIKTIDKAGTK